MDVIYLKTQYHAFSCFHAHFSGWNGSCGRVGESGVKAAIKWPNDIVCSGKKVCGILTEMSAEMEYINYIVIGIGINVNTKEFRKRFPVLRFHYFRKIENLSPGSNHKVMSLKSF